MRKNRKIKKNTNKINIIKLFLLIAIIGTIVGIGYWTSIVERNNAQPVDAMYTNEPNIQEENQIENVVNEVENVIQESEEKSNEVTNTTSATTPAPTNLGSYNKPYYIKVNYSQNCVTIYEKDSDGNYTKPVKAMICSTGKATPKSGVYSTSDKYRWGWLNGGVFGQYSTRITGSILFHSVPYLKNNDSSSLEYWEYDKLGTSASQGCVRLTVADTKWIYDNCAKGTKVEFYSDSNPGPLGKPTAQKISDAGEELRNWDPTDPAEGNPWKNKKKEDTPKIEITPNTESTNTQIENKIENVTNVITNEITNNTQNTINEVTNKTESNDKEVNETTNTKNKVENTTNDINSIVNEAKNVIKNEL